MMTSSDFFERLSAQYAMRLPFAAYNKPNSVQLQVIFQNDTELHHVNDYTESGFAFSPFSKEKKVVLIPGKPLEAETDFDSKMPFFEENLSIIENDKEEHLTLVNQAIHTIEKGNLKKVVISRKQEINTDENPLQLFKRLLRTYPEAFTYIFFHPKVGLWLGATPEKLVQVDGLQFETMALAGTQVAKEDQDIIWDKKEIDEQQFVVEDIENKLQQLNLKNIKVHERNTLRTGNLLHLHSKISGFMQRSKDDLKNLIETLHPTPAVCGLPQDIALSFILENENYGREFYTGFLGELNIETEKHRSNHRRNVENLAYRSVKRSSALYVNLRCLQYKAQEVVIYIGGGITRDSIAEREWEETVAKAQTMMRILS
ncbi:MAG: chorismate-binding protein [Leeuwenhoekiella sp.]